jgi:uncharacterized protein (DUF1330 family)
MSGELPHTPAVIVAQMLVDLGVADYPEDDGLTDWVVFPTHLPEAPDQAMAVVDTAGRLHRRMHVTGVIGEHYGLQFLVRGARAPVTSYSKCKAVMEFLDTEVNREIVTIDEYTYRVNAITRTSVTMPAGRDGARFLHSGNAIASIELLSVETGTGTGS